MEKKCITSIVGALGYVVLDCSVAMPAQIVVSLPSWSCVVSTTKGTVPQTSPRRVLIFELLAHTAVVPYRPSTSLFEYTEPFEHRTSLCVKRVPFAGLKLNKVNIQSPLIILRPCRTNVSYHQIWIWLPKEQISICTGEQIGPRIVAYNSGSAMSR